LKKKLKSGICILLTGAFAFLFGAADIKKENIPVVEEITTKILVEKSAELEASYEIAEVTETTVPETTTMKPTTTTPITKPATTAKHPVVSADKEPETGVDAIKTLSGFKNTGLPISELTPPDTLKLDENGIPTEYKAAYNAKATAYNGGYLTASGKKPMPGRIAVDPRQFPYGTELYIVSADGAYVYGYCVAEDTGGFVHMGNTNIDVYLDNVEMCRYWGNRDVVIYVL